jgi:hypothetical protein
MFRCKVQSSQCVLLTADEAQMKASNADPYSLCAIILYVKLYHMRVKYVSIYFTRRFIQYIFVLTYTLHMLCIMPCLCIHLRVARWSKVSQYLKEKTECE